MSVSEDELDRPSRERDGSNQFSYSGGLLAAKRSDARQAPVIVTPLSVAPNSQRVVSLHLYGARSF